MELSSSAKIAEFVLPIIPMHAAKKQRIRNWETAEFAITINNRGELSGKGTAVTSKGLLAVLLTASAATVAVRFAASPLRHSGKCNVRNVHSADCR